MPLAIDLIAQSPLGTLLIDMQQLHIVQDISVKSGGLGLAALRYAQALSRQGVCVTLFVVNRYDDELEFEVAKNQFELISGKNSILALQKCIHSGQFDVVHVHGLWSPILAWGGLLARMKRIALFISPHGCLEPWALKHKQFKKQLALMLYQRRILRSASLLVATSKQEVNSIRGTGFHQYVAQIPNGVEKIADSYQPSHKPTHTILFLSRVHPQKGLGDLVTAWARIKQTGWRVVIAGPSEESYQAEIKRMSEDLGVGSDFEFIGLVTGDAKERCFANADIFVLPTYSENFGIAIAEALARGLPVITTTGAPWQDLVTHECGWWIEPNPAALANALSSAMGLPKETLVQMGERGRQLVTSQYSWDTIGKNAKQASEWILKPTATRPPYIY